MSMVSHKTVKLVITTGDPIDFSKLAKKESMDNVDRWIVSISHTVRMIDFHQQEYRNLHERHLNGKSPASLHDMNSGADCKVVSRVQTRI